VETYAFGTKGLRDSWLHHAGVLRHHARTLVRSAGGCPGYHSRASFEKVSINLIIGRPAGPATANIDVVHQSSRHVCWELEAGIPSIFRRRPRQQSDGRCESRWEEGREVDGRREVGQVNAASPTPRSSPLHQPPPRHLLHEQQKPPHPIMFPNKACHAVAAGVTLTLPDHVQWMPMSSTFQACYLSADPARSCRLPEPAPLLRLRVSVSDEIVRRTSCAQYCR
jgi:hypothetical protein